MRFKKALFMNAADGLLLMSEAGECLEVNRAYAEMHGYSLGEMQDIDIMTFDVNLTPEVHAQRMRRLIEGNSIMFEVEHRHRAGHTFPLEVSATAVELNDTRVFLGFHRDISVRRKAELALQESEERYRRLLSSVTDYIYTIAVADGRPVSTMHGEGCVSVTGYAPDQYRADPDLWYRMVYDEDRESVMEHTRRSMTGKWAESIEYRIVHRAGSIRWVRNTFVPRFDHQGRLAAIDGLISDITERKQLEDKLERARAQQEENLRTFSRRLIEVQEEERRSIARELHDEIGQSLTGLRLFAESMAEVLPPAHADRVRAMEVSLGELLSVVRNMSLHLRPAMLDDFGLVSSLQWYFDRFGARTGIAVDFRHRTTDRRFDRRKEIAFYRIMQEALTNAARHAAVKRVRVELEEEQGRMTLRIVDEGRGFNMLQCAYTGSGLSIIRERASMEGGQFRLRSCPGQGTEVAVTIPLRNGEEGEGHA